LLQEFCILNFARAGLRGGRFQAQNSRVLRVAEAVRLGDSRVVARVGSCKTDGVLKKFKNKSEHSKTSLRLAHTTSADAG